MPTGYTADIAKGISFEQYALSCARAFGALVMMRDEPSDAPIPEAFTPSDYHATALADARAKLAELQTMNGEALLAAHSAAVKADEARNAEYAREKADLRAKYEAMLVQAKAYKAPSPDHEEYARFMVAQIEQSIEFDCRIYPREPITADAATWLADQVQQALKSVRYHVEEHDKELARTASRNQWVSQLRQSLVSGANDNG